MACGCCPRVEVLGDMVMKKIVVSRVVVACRGRLLRDNIVVLRVEVN